MVVIRDSGFNYPIAAARPTLVVLLAILFLGLPALPQPALATPDAALQASLDLSSLHDSLAVWIDLSEILSSTLTARIQDGIDLGIRCEVSLTRPKRLLGAVQIASQSRNWTLSYHLATEQYRLTEPVGDSTLTVELVSLARVAAYLADSLSISLCPFDTLDPEEGYVVVAHITSISMSNNYLAGATGSDGSVLRSLFSAFLDFTGYGRESITLRTRTFRLQEIRSYEPSVIETEPNPEPPSR